MYIYNIDIFVQVLNSPSSSEVPVFFVWPSLEGYKNYHPSGILRMSCPDFSAKSMAPTYHGDREVSKMHVFFFLTHKDMMLVGKM